MTFDLHLGSCLDPGPKDREHKRRYDRSPAGQAKRRAWARSTKAKAMRAAYQKTDAYKESRRQYRASQKGKAAKESYFSRADVRKRGREQRREFKRERVAWLQDLKRKPCTDCGGVFDPVCMDFDHRPGERKLFGISSAVRRPMDVLLAEIAKCDLVCANCHRLRTFRQRNHRALCIKEGA